MIHYSSPDADRVIILYNPNAGRSDSLLRTNLFCHELRCNGLGIDLFTNLETVGEEANRLFRAGRLRALVGIGGDGTAAELVNRTDPGVPIALFPTGTANLIAKRFGLPKNPTKAMKMIKAGKGIVLDAGRMTRTAADSTGAVTEQERLFLVLATAGIDAEIVRRVHANREKNFQKGDKKGAHIGYCSYIRPIVESIFSYRWPAMQVTVSEHQRLGESEMAEQWKAGPARWGFFFNIPQYGFGAPPVVGAVPNDRRLDYCLFKRGGFFASISALAASQFRLHRFFPGTALGSGRTFQINPIDADCPVPVELDGDPAGFLPVRIETVPARFTLLVPDRTIQRMVHDQEKNRKIEPEQVLGAEFQTESEKILP